MASNGAAQLSFIRESGSSNIETRHPKKSPFVGHSRSQNKISKITNYECSVVCKCHVSVGCCQRLVDLSLRPTHIKAHKPLY